MSWFYAFCAAASCAAIFSAVGRAAAAELKAGDKAPDFTLPGSDGKTYHLADFRDKQVVVLAWFPMAFTPGCTTECKSFRESGDALRKFDAAYFTASRDTAEKNRKFAESLAVDYPILSDPAGDVARAYGVVGGIRPLGAALDVLHRQGREDSLHRQVGEDGHPRGRRGGEAEGVGGGGEEGALSGSRGSPLRLRSSRSTSARDHCLELRLRNHLHAELPGLVELAPGLLAGDDVVGVLRDAGGRMAAVPGDQLVRSHRGCT